MEKTKALSILKASLAAVEPARAIPERVGLRQDLLTVKGPGNRNAVKLNLRQYNSLYILGAGKAAAAMAAACEKILGGRIRQGLVVTKYGHGRVLKHIRVVEAGHPVPDRAGREGAREMLSFLRQAGKGDLIIFLTSGGCSALLPAPVPSVPLKDKQKLTGLLLRSGATIQEINTVRKHISLSKGGRLARAAFPARVVNLIVSDVVGDDLDIIGSGPFVPDPSTYRDSLQVLEKYRLIPATPAAIVAWLKKGSVGAVEETPKPGDPLFNRVTNLILINNRAALTAAAARAEAWGFQTLLLTSGITGEARTLAQFYGALAREIQASGHPAKPPACLLAGGEPTVTLKGRGLGGRNTELALAVAREIKGLPGTLFLSAGTDGTDGPTDAAGATVDGRTWARALKKGLIPEKYLEENDSYHFFQEAGGLVITGPTGTNVMDVHILLIS
jgi:hydroxypyruvate reductase